MLTRMVWSTFFHVCPFEKRGRDQAIWAMPVWKQHISKRGFPNLSEKRKEGILNPVGSNVRYEMMKLCTGPVLLGQ